MIILPILLLGLLPSCLQALSTTPMLQDIPMVKRQNSSHLDTLPDKQRQLFEYAMEGLDAYFAPPFLVRVFVIRMLSIILTSFQFKSPRYSAWYAVGLLARNEDDDVQVASTLIRNV